jgi:2-polyprenyl-6-methoxyphenol hydroxylase-like FAD-dependent oxidoreductase
MKAGGAGRHAVVVVGGGFAGLNAVKALRGLPVEVTLVDRRNHHLFQPLLYQVATADRVLPSFPLRSSIRARGLLEARQVEIWPPSNGRGCACPAQRRRPSRRDDTPPVETVRAMPAVSRLASEPNFQLWLGPGF